MIICPPELLYVRSFLVRLLQVAKNAQNIPMSTYEILAAVDITTHETIFMNAVPWGQKYPKHAHRIGLRPHSGILFLAVSPSSGK